MTTWDDLTEEEREFLLAWRQADADRRADALAIMLNHQQRGGDGSIINIEDFRRTKGNPDS